MKLSKAQEKTYNEMVNALNEVKQFDNLEDYIEYCFKTSNLAYKTLDEYKKGWDGNFAKYDTERFEMSRENKTWSFYNSSTIRSLEKKGLIKIHIDGGNHRDIVEIL